jgi:hypothetical protein
LLRNVHLIDRAPRAGVHPQEALPILAKAIGLTEAIRAIGVQGAHPQVSSARLIAEKLSAVPDHQTVVFACGHSG